MAAFLYSGQRRPANNSLTSIAGALIQLQLQLLQAVLRIKLHIPSPASSATIILKILLIAHLSGAAAQSTSGFVSIDCGSSRRSNYTDALGIEWAPDALLWPDIGGWSKTAAISPPSTGTTGDEQDDKYKTLRYFQAPAGNTSAALTTPTKFCYVLPAIEGAYYLIRATFWYGTSATTTLYGTHEPGIISFRMIVDTYVGEQISVSLPQSRPLTEEMYVRVQNGSTSVSVCFSAAGSSEGGTGDAPFINALELRPLPNDLTSVAMVNKTNAALRRVLRADFGVAQSAPPVIRYPNDTLDRLWATSYGGDANRTSEAVLVRNCDYVPVAVVQTSYVARSISGWHYQPTLAADSRPHKYFLALLFAEIDPRVNAPGQRVFDLTLNGITVYQGFDVYSESKGLYVAREIYAVEPYGPYSSIVINATGTTTSLFPPFLAGLEILQLLDDPMAPPTSATDVSGIGGIISAFSSQLGRFSGDPCLPVPYPYPWINCTDQGILPTRVISISLSNSNLVGKIPPSITNLEQLVEISFDGNALDGTLPPDLTNLVNLQVLNLSNNNLNGFIPDWLGELPRLTHLDLRNNNFSGQIPLSLQQKASKGQLDFRYDGNPFLCLSSNGTCAASASTPSPSKLSLIVVGLAIGAAATCVAVTILITCIIIRKRRIKQNPSLKASSSMKELGNHYASTPHNADNSHVLSHTRMVEAANISQCFTYQDVVTATGNFSTILGKGGFAMVYKGTLKNGTTDIAVKVLLDASKRGEQQFLTEVTILSLVRHKNLVRLLGYCNEEKLILVYEYMPNGSLHDYLFNNSSLAPTASPLSWIQRLQIMLDAARGLAYLHGNCEPRIIHMDVKSSNILLNKALEAKVSDFGISRQHSSDGAQLTTTLVASEGYMDPEFATTLEWSERVDVYSFGVVLLEVMSGQKPFIKDLENPNEAIHIVEWARDHFQCGNIESILFNGIGDYNESAVWKVAEIAMACAQHEGWKRPSMDEVCNELGEALRLEKRYDAISLYASTADAEVEQLPIADQVYLR